MEVTLRDDTAPTEPMPPVDMLVGFETPVGIIRNVRSVLLLLSTINLEQDTSPRGSDMGYWLILKSATNALQHAEKLLMAEAREATS